MALMEDYAEQDLLTLVSGLSELYTHKESTSVSYECAQALMKAVLFCIDATDTAEAAMIPLKNDRPDAVRLYEIGYENICAAAARVRKKYMKLMAQFDAYGNQNYKLTIQNGVVGFVRYYDPRFNPTDTVITMDYPTLLPVEGERGAFSIEQYVDYIQLEQKFLACYTKTYIRAVLTAYQKNYQIQFYNICRIVLRYVLAGYLIETSKCLMSHEDLFAFEEYVKCFSKDQLAYSFRDITQEILESQGVMSRELMEYLCADIDDFCTEIENGLAHDCIEHIFRIG